MMTAGVVYYVRRDSVPDPGHDNVITFLKFGIVYQIEELFFW